MDDARTWELIHRERAAMADTLDRLEPADWDVASWCGVWSVHVTAGHILVGAEQTRGRFLRRMAANGFRFNTMMDRDAHRAAALPSHEIIERLRATTTTTNRPPAPVATMLGEIVVHGEDVRRPLRIADAPSVEATVACLELYKNASFPLGTKKRIAGLRLVATDVDWSHGVGAAVSGAGSSLLLAMTGRPAVLDELTGEGVATLRTRMARRSREESPR